MQDLTQGSVPRHLITQSVPIALGMLVQTLYYLVDIYFVAQLGGTVLAGGQCRRQSHLCRARADADVERRHRGAHCTGGGPQGSGGRQSDLQSERGAVRVVRGVDSARRLHIGREVPARHWRGGGGHGIRHGLPAVVYPRHGAAICARGHGRGAARHRGREADDDRADDHGAGECDPGARADCRLGYRAADGRRRRSGNRC